nr:MAG TPA: hypothetical protein [Caudoviricetes sp.]
MEEYEDILEDFLEYNSFLENSVTNGDIREFEVYMSKNDYKAIQNLLARYKELEKQVKYYKKLYIESNDWLIDNHIPRID